MSALVACACAAVASPKSSLVGIAKQESDVQPDGSYHFSFESEDGQGVEQTGHLKKIGEQLGAIAEGSYHYIAPDGTPINVKYVADEYGFQAQGSHFPVAPAVPAGIVRGLEYIKSHPHVEDTNWDDTVIGKMN